MATPVAGQNQVERATQPVKSVWELKTRAGMEETWEILADTDRFNRVAGVGFVFKETPQSDGTTLRQGEMKRLGMRLRWKDLPFQYRTPEWFRKERLFDTGPISALVTTLRLRPDKEGTAIRYTVEAFPRHPLYRPIVALDFAFTTRPQVQRTLDAVLKLLAGQAAEQFDPLPPPLDNEKEARLSSALSRIKPEKLANALGQYIRRAPLREQDRMMPLRLARRWGMAEDVVLEGFLRAAGEGVLALKWDVICPSCRMPKQRAQSLQELLTETHCPSCNIKFDGTFPDSVEVSFRPAPAIRDFGVDVACLGSPGRQAHIVAQDRVEPGGELEFTLPLVAGPYRIRSWPPREACVVEVRDKGLADDGQLTLGLYDFQPARTRLVAGTRKIVVKNVIDRAVDVILEKQWRPNDLLTAGRLLESPTARALLPGGTLPPGFKAELLPGCVLVVEVLKGGKPAAESVYGLLKSSSPRRIQQADLRILSTWASVEAAISAARSLVQQDKVRSAINVGNMLEDPTSDKLPVMGSVTDEALSCLRGAGPGVVAIPEKSAHAREVEQALARVVGTLVPPDYQMPGCEPALWIRF